MAERPGPVREWRIHLGAHKTATTHLQQTLEAHRPALVERGVDFIHFRAFRSVAAPYVRPNSWQRRLWSPPVARRFERALDGLRATGPDTVLLSDEDILGYSRDQLGQTLYPQPRALHLVRHLAGRAERASLFLAIRSLDGLLPSAYAQALKAEPYPPGSLDALCRRVAEAPPSWVELIERIQAAVPGVPLRVWRYEHYRDHWREILATYAGRETGALPEVPPVRGTASPALRAIEAAEQLDPALPQEVRIARVREIYAAYPAGAEHGRLAPLSDAQTDRLRARYAADLDSIAARWPGMLIAPVPAVA